MSWQDDAMAEQEIADALFEMGEAEWRDMYEDKPEPKRGRGRPRKSEEEKKARRKAYNRVYWKKWEAAMTDEQRAARKRRSIESHMKWRKAHKEEYNAYHREYRRKKKEALDKKA